jgi:fructoselysine-6-P-deglycase FrlB-like protein
VLYARHFAVGQEPRPAGRGAKRPSKAGAFVVALVNDEDFARWPTWLDELLPLHAGPELSVAATKSYIASLAGHRQLVAATWTGDEALIDALSATCRPSWPTPGPWTGRPPSSA